MADPLASWMWMSLTAPADMQPMADHVFLNMDVVDRSVPTDKKVQLPETSLDVNLEVGSVDPSGKEMRSGDDNFISEEDKENVVVHAREEDSLSDDLADLLPAAVTSSKDRPWIWRVHPNVRNKDDEAYEPRIVSIGPLHHGKKALQPMEDVKKMYLRFLLDRSPKKNTLQNYFRVISKCENRARKQYAEVINMDSMSFRKMLVLDGCFMIEYFLRNYSRQTQIHNDQLVRVGWNLDPLHTDLKLLENQIPFFVLVNLYQASTISEKSYGSTEEEPPPSLVTIALSFLGLDKISKNKHPKAEKVYHLLHLQYDCLTPNISPRADPPLRHSSILMYPFEKVFKLSSFIFYALLYVVLIKFLGERGQHLPWNLKTGVHTDVSIPCATELHKLGVKFERKQLTGEDLNITFSDEGRLAIPRYVVGTTTISRLRNFIAFEKCHFIGNYFTEYAIFMSNIIDTADDVAILRKYGIIETTMGTDKQLAKTFNELLVGIEISHAPYTFDIQKKSPLLPNRIRPLFEQVNKFCDSRQQRWKATLRSSHLRSPWAIVTLLAVIIGVTAAIVQMVFTILRPP